MPLLQSHSGHKFPVYGWVGLALVVIFWFVNWMAEGLRSHYGFFFLWLGFILFVDGINYRLRASSLLTKSWKAFVGLFVISIPVWWLFELLDERTRYWYYDGAEYFSCLAYFLLASLSFSTVVPAVFESVDLIDALAPKKKFKGPRVNRSEKTARTFFVTGWASLVLTLAWPEYFPFFLWTSLYFITEAVNVWLGRPTLLDHTRRQNWRPAIILGAGGLLCGFFWEMWNFYSYPKWIYEIPNYNFRPVFEMPVLGYLGYIPFSFELYAFYNLVAHAKFIKKKGGVYFSVSS